MGMSSDFREAIAEGATLLRVGTALFGPRAIQAPEVTDRKSSEAAAQGRGLDRMPAMQTTSAGPIAFIGGGNMARALIAGLLRQQVAPLQIRVGEPHGPTREALARDYGVVVSADNAAVLAGATLVVLAVKPADATGALQAVRESLHALTALPVLLSVAAGLTVAELARHSPPGCRSSGRCPWSPGAARRRHHRAVRPCRRDAGGARTCRVAEPRGRPGRVGARRERAEHRYSPLGQRPSLFLVAGGTAGRSRRIARAGTCDRHTARDRDALWRGIVGAHRTLEVSGTGLAQERIAVTSKGGTTEAALNVLTAGDFAGLVARALQAATARSATLAAGER